MLQPLEAAQVRRTCDPAMLGFQTTADVPPLQAIIGQQRAVEALEFGLGIRQPGFNIFVTGEPGTGKSTAVRNFLELRARAEPAPQDWCHVNSFRDSYRPQAISLPAGQGRVFREDMRQLLQRARIEIPTAFESEEYTTRRDEIQQAIQEKQGEIMAELGQKAEAQGFVIQSTPVGFFIVPVVNGKPLTDEQFMALDNGTRRELQVRREALETELKARLKEVRDLQREAQQRAAALNREVTLHVVGGLFDDLQEKYRGGNAVIAYLKAVKEDMVTNVEQFLNPPQAPTPQAAAMMQEVALRKYDVNLVVDNSSLSGAPVVHELNPTYPNLFGRLEREALFGVLQTDFTLIKGGSLHRANGGYLVLPVEELLRNLGSYESLKRAIRNREIVIEDLTDRMGLATTKSLQPEPIPLSVKVVLTGSPAVYALLFRMDEEFREVFKVKADFDNAMERNGEALQLYSQFICALGEKEGLKPFECAAVAKVVELGSRLAADQEKLTTRFGELADILREASYWAERDKSECVTVAHVKKAVDARTYRSNLIEERIRELIAKGVILVDTEGAAAGQVNGLAVLMLGDYTFGKPSRITATIGLGRAGLIDIEREAKLGGPIHTKGVLILGGYVSWRYAQDKPLSLAARLVFEQSYEGVEGDSASSTELYALLSALSGLPIKQGMAVTGSVNQWGQVQAIGGVNQKIEGFFDVCHVKGFTGEQGVVIPSANVKNLMLREDVVEAIAQGKFHIWAVSTIDEGIEVLTGVPAGQRDKEGKFPEGTVNYLVDRKLHEMAERLQSFSGNGAATAPASRE
ncbi:MAG: AAA family ATPase [Chloroflexi bacterium]|nr:AAA family ATPase [Chloroflexota bacterium]